MRALILGGTGFIGSRTTQALLDRGVSVSAFQRGTTRAGLPASVTCINGDRNDLTRHADDLRASAPDVVLDMTALTEEHARLVVEVFRGVVRRVVAISSMDVYRAFGVYNGVENGAVQAVPLTEEAELRSRLFLARDLPAPNRPPDRPPDYEKLLVEQTYLAEPAFTTSILRLPFVYGPGDWARHRTLPYVKQIHDGRQVISLSEGASAWAATRGYVEDIAADIADAVVADNTEGGSYNLGEIVPATELEWVERLIKVAEWPGRVVVVPDDAMPPVSPPGGNTAQHLVLDVSKGRRVFGFRDRTDPDEAMLRTIHWERANLSAGSGSLDRRTRPKTIVRP